MSKDFLQLLAGSGPSHWNGSAFKTQKYEGHKLERSLKSSWHNPFILQVGKLSQDVENQEEKNDYITSGTEYE